MNKNSNGYIHIAMLRNEKFNAIQRILTEMQKNSAQAETGITPDQSDRKAFEEKRIQLMKLNEEYKRIESGMVTSLFNIKSTGRATLYKDVQEAQRNAEFEIYRLNIQKVATASDIDKLSNATVVKEAADHIERLLQIHFPEEYPCPLVDEVFSFLKDQSQDEEQPISSESTYAQVLRQLTETRDAIGDTLIGDAAPVISASNETESYLEESTEPAQPTILATQIILPGYQPKVISLFEKYRESQLQLTTETTNVQSTQGVIDTGVSQIIDNGPSQN